MKTSLVFIHIFFVLRGYSIVINLFYTDFKIVRAKLNVKHRLVQRNVRNIPVIPISQNLSPAQSEAKVKKGIRTIKMTFQATFANFLSTGFMNLLGSSKMAFTLRT